MVLSFYIYIYIYIYDSTQTYTKLKIYDHETPKCSKGIWETGNGKKTNIRKYFLKKNI